MALSEASNGAVRVVDICADLGVNPRELIRRFTHIVGVTPKLFGQVMQINWVVGLLYANDTAGLAQIGKADRDNEERFESLAKGDDERLANHEWFRLG